MDIFQREQRVSDIGCLVNTGLIILGICVPFLLIFIIPYLIYEWFQDSKRNREIDQIKQSADKVLDEQLRGLTADQIEARRIEYVMMLQSPFSTQAEKDAAAYAIKYIEKHYPKY